jgi:hypothetical protein
MEKQIIVLKTGKDHWVQNVASTKAHRIYGPCKITITTYDDGGRDLLVEPIDHQEFTDMLIAHYESQY